MERSNRESEQRSAKAKPAAMLAMVAALAACGPRDIIPPEDAQTADLPKNCSDLLQTGALAPNLAIHQCDRTQTKASSDPTRAAPECGSRVVDGDGDTGVLRTHFKLDVFRACQGPVIVRTIVSMNDGHEEILRGRNRMDRGGSSSVDSKLVPGITAFQLEAEDAFGNTFRTNPPTPYRQ